MMSQLSSLNTSFTAFRLNFLPQHKYRLLDFIDLKGYSSLIENSDVQFIHTKDPLYILIMFIM